MSETLFIAVGWMLLLGGAAVAYWWGWRDPHSRIRRCPTCRYEMTATAGRKCPECGTEARNEKVMLVKRRRYRWIAAGLLLALSSWFAFRWPEYQKTGVSTGPLAFVPRTVLVVAWPAIAKWQGASSDSPDAWWAKSDARTHWYLSGAISDDKLWGWQRWMKLRVASEAIQRTTTWSVLYSATDIICESGKPPEWAVDAFMARYVDQSPERAKFGRWEERAKLGNTPARWREPVAKAIAANVQILRWDPEVLRWFAADGRNMNDMADVVVRNKFPRDLLTKLAWPFVEANLDQAHLAALVSSFRSRSSVNRGTLMQLVARLDDRGNKYAGDLATAVGGGDIFTRLNGCIAAAQFGSADPIVLDVLRGGQSDGHQAVCIAARLAEAVLLRDEEKLLEVVEDAATFVWTVRDRDRRLWVVFVLQSFAEKGLLPRDLAIRAMHAAAHGDGNDNWFQSMKSMSLLLDLVDDSEPGVIEFVVGRIDEGGQIGNSAWYHYVKKGCAPKAVVDAARRAAVGMSGSLAVEREKQLREMEVQP
ncbi:MAG: hypothetical protein JNK16_14695 [Phycisphaerales bacterium]|nr:hypothetical protein [Phycisphaerales bacterium]